MKLPETMIESLPKVFLTLVQPLVDPTSRTFGPWLLVAGVVATLWCMRSMGSAQPLWRRVLAPRLWVHPSSLMDLQMLLARRLLALSFAVPEVALALALARLISTRLDAAVGVPSVSGLSGLPLTVVYTVVLFVLWDASRYVLHRLMHGIPLLWEVHQVHHSAEVLTPMTFHRIHPIESVLYGLRGVVVSGGVGGLFFWAFRGDASPWMVWGVHGVGLMLNAVFGNLRHSHVWMGFGALESWLISPAQHQLHHSMDARQQTRNYGTWLAVWDRLGGSWQSSGVRPTAFGVDAAGRNHDPRSLWSALVGPLKAWRSMILGLGIVMVCVWSADSAWAQSDELDAGGAESEAEAPSADVSADIIVYAYEGVPRVAGSAQRVDEEQLDRFEYDDIHEVLGEVAGVYVRGEDGFGLRPNIGIRGANADRSARITLMEDGIPMAPAPYAAPAAYYFPLVTRLTGVEVFKGPASIRHGPQTIGGAVNLLTREVPKEASGATDVALGLRSTVSAHGWAGANHAASGFVIEAAHLSSDGFKTLDTGGPTGFDRQDLMAKGRLELPGGTVKQSLELKLGYGHERSYETYIGIAGSDFETDPYRRYASSDGDIMQWNRTQASLSWIAVGPSVSARVTAYHHYLDRSWFKLNRFADGPDLHALFQQEPGGQAAVFLDILRGDEDTTTSEQILLRGTNHRTFHNGGVQGRVEVRTGEGQVENTLELGARIHQDWVHRDHDEEPWAMMGGLLERADGPIETTTDRYSVAQALAVHVHDRLRLGRVELVPGMRTEVVQTREDDVLNGTQTDALRVTPLPGMGALVQVVDWMDVFAGVHRGFSPVPPGESLETRPESAISTELGARAASGETHVEWVGFTSFYGSIAGQCTLSSGCVESQLDQQFDGGQARVLGLEGLVAHTVPLPNQLSMSVNGAYTLTQGQFLTSFASDFPQFGDVEAGDVLPYVPAHQGAAQVALIHPRFDLAVSVQGRTQLRDSAGQGPVDPAAEVPGIVTVDGAAGYLLADWLELYLSATNLTGVSAVQSWRPVGARPTAPFQFMLGVKSTY